MLELEELTECVISAAFEVHNHLGGGFLEAIYEEALGIELGMRGIHYERQVEIPLFYKSMEVGKHRLDLLVENSLVVELKTVRAFENVHFAIVKSYLKAANLKHGLLLNFAKSSVEVKRVIFDPGYK